MKVATIFDAGQEKAGGTQITFVMRNRLLSVLGLAFLACGVPHFSVQAETRPPAEDTLLKIEAGRLDAMLDQVALLLRVKADETLSTSDNVEAEIRGAMKRYNDLRALACARGVVDAPPCGSIYVPSFSSATPLQEQIDDATSHIYPFWVAVCGKLDDSAHGTCQME